MVGNAIGDGQGSNYACRQRFRVPSISHMDGEYVMDVSRLILIAAAALVLAIPAARAQEDDEAVAALAAQARGPAKPWKFVRGLGRVLNLSKPPIVIDEPGLYVIQQNWQIPEATTNVVGEVIQITADQVTLDLHGFDISARNVSLQMQLTMLVITGSGAEIRNGGISVCCDGGVAVAVTVDDGIFGPNLHHLSIRSWNTMKFDADFTTISDSSITSRGGIQLAGSSNLERNAIVGDFVCAILGGDRNRITDNRMLPNKSDCVEILGNDNVVANNVVDASNVEAIRGTFDVQGDHNVVRNNTVLVGHDVSTLVRVSGTANTLDGNIAAPSLTPLVPMEPRARTGIEFTADGNYYGNNRIAAEVPFALGGTVQTDWGGNVGY